MKRLIRKSDYLPPLGILFKDIQMDVDNDKIQGIEYFPTNSKEWKFEKPIDNQEWNLQKSFTKNLSD